MSVSPWCPNHHTDEYTVSVEPPGYIKTIPNIIKGWEINEDATEFTFFLRKGMKWSDGAPFTADDWIFWYEAIEGNAEFSPIRRSWYSIGGEHGVLSKVDDCTIKWTFCQTFGSLLDALAEWPVRGEMQFAPAHYLKQFHPDYQTPDELKKKMTEGGFDTWMNLFGVKLDHMNNPDRPVIRPWVVMNEKGSEIQLWERNPYFWKVDPEGNQLPYLDYAECPSTAGKEATLLRMIAGELDLVEVGCAGGLTNFTTIMENRERGNYRTVKKVGGKGAHNVGAFLTNVSHKDPAKRELFTSLDFRKALSVAINREEIIAVAYKGMGIPTQVSPATGPPYHGERPEFKEYYTQYDPALANQLLDGIGLTERDNEGYRLKLDGEKLLIILQVQSAWIAELPDIADMLKEYFGEVGLNCIVKPMPKAAVYKVVEAVEHDIFIRYFAGGDTLYSPANPYLFPRTVPHFAAPMWSLWILTDGEQGEEPPEWVKRIAQIDDETKAEVNQEKRIALFNEAVLLHVNNLLPIGILGGGGLADSVFLLHNRIRNVPVPIDLHLICGQLSSWYILEENQ